MTDTLAHTHWDTHTRTHKANERPQKCLLHIRKTYKTRQSWKAPKLKKVEREIL